MSPAFHLSVTRWNETLFSVTSMTPRPTLLPRRLPARLSPDVAFGLERARRNAGGAALALMYARHQRETWERRLAADSGASLPVDEHQRPVVG